eukprot:g2239.t1
MCMIGDQIPEGSGARISSDKPPEWYNAGIPFWMDGSSDTVQKELKSYKPRLRAHAGLPRAFPHHSPGGEFQYPSDGVMLSAVSAPGDPLERGPKNGKLPLDPYLVQEDGTKEFIDRIEKFKPSSRSSSTTKLDGALKALVDMQLPMYGGLPEPKDKKTVPKYTRYNGVIVRNPASMDAPRMTFAAPFEHSKSQYNRGHDMVDAPSGPGGYRNDVWKSEDKGVSWSMVNNRSAWSPRDAHAVVRLSDDTIILTGGHDGANDPSQWHHDVWESRDGGSSWKVMTRTAEWSPRSAHAVTTFDDSLFLMGGWGDSGLLNDVWYSRTGGSSWEFIGTAPWEARWWFSAVTSGSDIVVLGGINEQGDDLGDVWSLSVAKNETKSQTVFSLIPAARSREDATNNVIGDLLCLEGTHDDVESALHELRSSPVAALYEASVVTPSSCFDRGFISEASASDQCFPTLRLHYRPLTLPNYPGVPQTDRANLYQYRSIVDGVLIGHDYNMKQKNGTSTICRRNVTLPPAIDMLPRRDEIPRSAFDSGVGSHVPDAGLLCNEGPLTGNYTIYDMVRTLKNGSLASIQQLDGVQAGTPCHSRGFVVSQGKSDRT